MSLETMRLYIKAREALQEGDRTAAYRGLVDSLGVEPQGDYLQENLEGMMDLDTRGGMTLLDLVTREALKGEKPNDNP